MFDKNSKTLIDLGFEFNWKQYLDIGEIASIIVQMLEQDDFASREVVRSVLLIKFCTDIKFDEVKTDEEIYDEYVKNGLIPLMKENVVNWNLVDEGYNEEISINQSIRSFLNHIVKSIDNIEKKFPENFDLNDTFNKLQEVIENGNLNK